MNLIILLASIFICGSATYSSGQAKSKFKFELLKPKLSQSDPMTFGDDKIRAEFTIDRSSINFILENKGSKPIKIIWDESSIVLNRQAEKVTHTGIKNIDRAASQPPTLIPPNASISDLAIPTGNIYWSTTFKDWAYRPLIEDYGNNEDKIGTTVSLYLSIVINAKTLFYQFDFKVISIKKAG